MSTSPSAADLPSAGFGHGSTSTAARTGRPTQSGGRAAPLPPGERRAGIIAAALPLISRFGTDVTTRQIAEAAGIAEGTIFRVFPDKDSLIRSAVESAMDQTVAIGKIAAIDSALPLSDRMEQAVDIIRHRLSDVWRLISALRMYGPPEQHPAQRRPSGAQTDNEALMAALTAVLEPAADELRVTPEYAARVLRLLVFSGTHPRITDENPLTTKEIVSILLDGLRAHAP